MRRAILALFCLSAAGCRWCRCEFPRTPRDGDLVELAGDPDGPFPRDGGSFDSQKDLDAARRYSAPSRR